MTMAITHTNDTEEIQYFVIHSELQPECSTCLNVSILELEPGSTFSTGQPYAESFDTYTAAEERAVELGYKIPVTPDEV